VNESLLQARELQAAGNIPGAVARLGEALKAFPNELRLAQLRSTRAGMNSACRAAAPPAPIPEPPAADPEPPPVVEPVPSQQAQLPEETLNGRPPLFPNRTGTPPSSRFCGRRQPQGRGGMK
jgi:hypothetical protein